MNQMSDDRPIPMVNLTLDENSSDEQNNFEVLDFDEMNDSGFNDAQEYLGIPETWEDKKEDSKEYKNHTREDSYEIQQHNRIIEHDEEQRSNKRLKVEKSVGNEDSQSRSDREETRHVIILTSDEEDNDSLENSGNSIEGIESKIEELRKGLRTKYSMIEILTNKLVRRENVAENLRDKRNNWAKIYGEVPPLSSHKRMMEDLLFEIQSADERTQITRAKLLRVSESRYHLEDELSKSLRLLQEKTRNLQHFDSITELPVPDSKNIQDHEIFMKTVDMIRTKLDKTDRSIDNKMHIHYLCDRLLDLETAIFNQNVCDPNFKDKVNHTLSKLTNQGIRMPFILKRFQEYGYYDGDILETKKHDEVDHNFKPAVDKVFELVDKLEKPDSFKNEIRKYMSIVSNAYYNHHANRPKIGNDHQKVSHALLRLSQLGVRIPYVVKEMEKLNYSSDYAIDSVGIFKELKNIEEQLHRKSLTAKNLDNIIDNLHRLESFFYRYIEGEEVINPDVVKNIFQIMARFQRLDLNLPFTVNALHNMGLSWDNFIDVDYFLQSIKKVKEKLSQNTTRQKDEIIKINDNLAVLEEYIKIYDAEGVVGDDLDKKNKLEVCHSAHVLYASGIVLKYCIEVLEKLHLNWKYYPEKSLEDIDKVIKLIEKDEDRTVNDKKNLISLINILEDGIKESMNQTQFKEIRKSSFLLTLSTLLKNGCKILSVELTYDSIMDGSYLQNSNDKESKLKKEKLEEDLIDLNYSNQQNDRSPSLFVNENINNKNVLNKSLVETKNSFKKPENFRQTLHILLTEIENATVRLTSAGGFDEMSKRSIRNAFMNIERFLNISETVTPTNIKEIWRSSIQISIEVLDRFSYLGRIPKTLEYLAKYGFAIPEQYLDDDDLTELGRTNLRNDVFSDNSSEEDDDIDEMLERYDTKMDKSLRMTNIYNAADASSLRDLLEGLKETETEVEGEEMTPNELTVNLLKHQRKGLRWLLGMEKSSKKGGLLADDMGLGKTVQSLALMMAHKPEVNARSKTTLIIAPVAVLRVWKDEIAVKIKKEVNMKVVIFGGGEHNNNKFKNWKDLSKYDVVLVSYQTLASEFKKHWPINLKDDSTRKADIHAVSIESMNKLKKDFEYFSPFYQNDSQFYRVILDEAQNIKNKNTQAAKACCTISSTYRWTLSGTPIQNNIGELYSLIRFLRIPPYNKEAKFQADIGHILNTKRVSNYDDFEKKQAMKKVRVLLRAIMLRRTKNSQIDGKPILELPAKHISNISDKLENDEAEFYSKLEMKSQAKAKKMMESRQKQGAYSSILTLLLRLRQACLHSELVKIGESKAEDGKVVNGKDFEKDWKRLYLIAKKMSERETTVNTVNECLDTMSCPFCMEQMEIESMVVINPCGHCICSQCIEPFVDNAKLEPGAAFGPKGTNSINVPCLVCKKTINDKEMVSYQLYEQVVGKKYTLEQLREEYDKVIGEQRNKLKNGYKIDFNSLQKSKKVELCLDIIKKVTDSNPDEKIVVFSQFTTFFEILQHFIHKDLGLQHLRYDGSMSSVQRSACIETFYRDPLHRIMLISMKAGNSGLTLTCANHVILVDPFWNPYVEEQAMDRCYRISQEREVYVHRLLIQSSVEDRIVELQNKKKELVDNAMDPTQMREVNSLGRRELGFLFGLNTLE